MSAGHTLAGYSLQIVGVLTVLGSAAYLLVGGAATLMGGLGGGLLVIASFLLFLLTVGVGLGFWYLGAMLARMGGRKK